MLICFCFLKIRQIELLDVDMLSLWCSVMNGPIVSIAKELGFEGNSFLEGLVVSIFIGGAFLGSLSCGSLVDKLGYRRTFQLDTIPLILGAIVRLVFSEYELNGGS